MQYKKLLIRKVVLRLIQNQFRYMDRSAQGDDV